MITSRLLARGLPGLPSFLALLLLAPIAAHATGTVEPWPAEPESAAHNLTALDQDFGVDLSGAFWNPHTKVLWTERNGPDDATSKIWSLQRNAAGGFSITGEWTGFGDLEDITQVNLDECIVYGIVEGDEQRVKAWNVCDPASPAVLVHDWDTKPFILEDGGRGAEGLTFVPDAFLTRAGFVDGAGHPYTSTGGMGGLMFVGHQGGGPSRRNGGGVFAFDLNPANDAVTYVGEYRMFMLDDTSSASNQYTESPAVSFDQSTGLLYVFHGEIPMLTVHDLASQPVAGQTYRLLHTLRTSHGPNESNPDYEGIALVPIGECVGGMRSVFMTVDDGGTVSLLEYEQFRDGCPDPALPTASPTPAVAATPSPTATPTATGACSNGTTCFTTSTVTETETNIIDHPVRIDRYSTRITATDPQGAIAYDQTFPVAYTDPSVQSAVETLEASLRTGPAPALVTITGPAVAASDVTLADTQVDTVETGRARTETTATTEYVGPQCLRVGDLDARNAAPCPGSDVCPVCASPANGDLFTLLAGQVDFDTLTTTHVTIDQMRTTTNTYLTSTVYTLTASALDDFVVYTVKPTPKLEPFGPVTLADALGSADYDARTIAALGVPANIDDAGLFDGTTYLARYAVKLHKGEAKFTPKAHVTVENACGGLTVTLQKPESLLVPVDASYGGTPAVPDLASSQVDPFLCYLVRPETAFPKGVQVDASDDLQTRRYDLTKVTRFCDPVAASGSPIDQKTGAPHPITALPVRHAAGHLLCYAAKIAKAIISQNGCGPADSRSKGAKITPAQPKDEPRTGVQLDGALGAATVDTKNAIEICIPSTATSP